MFYYTLKPFVKYLMKRALTVVDSNILYSLSYYSVTWF